MRIGRRTHGQSGPPAHGPSPALLTILLLLAVVGCGTRQTEQAPAASKPEGESSSQPAVVATAQESGTHVTAASRPAKLASSTGPIHRITLSDKRCIQFEPQWTSVHMGQSITWHSELESPITIYVSPGVFSKLSFVVRPGATVSTGPARAVGRFSFWTEPTACQDSPRGVLLSGPGVTVNETFYASTSGPR